MYNVYLYKTSSVTKQCLSAYNLISLLYHQIVHKSIVLMPKIEYKVWQLSMKPKIFYWNKHNGVNLKLYQKVMYKYNIKQTLLLLM